MDKILGGSLVLAFFIIGLLIGPVLFIWAANTLIIHSGLADIPKATSAFFNPIPLNFWTWLASVILFARFGGNKSKNSN